MIQVIETAAVIAGLGLAVLLAVFPRFGPGSRKLLCLILPACCSAGIQAFGSKTFGLSVQESFRLSFAFILFAASGGYLACVALNRRIRRSLTLPLCAATFLLVALLYFVTPPYAVGMHAPEGSLAFGPVGYISSLFLLFVSVIVLADIEQILRGSSESARWELKFLFLGIASLYASIIYMSSHALLFPPRSGLLSLGALGLLHAMFLVSCCLIAVSWKRGSGRAQVAVSHGFIYSSITLLSVGVYLISSSLIARWASQLGDIGLPLEALIFLLSAVVLAIVLLGTAFRHRVRRWLRRNIFAGRYDYRRFWLEATERIRSTDPPAAIAEALADIVHKAIGAIDISIWIRRWNPNRLHLVKVLGTIANPGGEEITDVVEHLIDASEPLSGNDLSALPEAEAARDFMEKTRASLLVPLVSSNRIVGILTVGSDRSGRPYDWEACEFLRVLAGHAAGEFHKSELLTTLVEAKEDEAFRAFSIFVLHDLKNFASTLSLIAQNAPRHQNNPEFQKDSFQSVYDTAEKMKRLCNNLRTFSTTLAANKEPTDLNQIVRSVADTLKGSFKEHLRFDLEELPPVVADAEEVGRVLQNLMLNAREAIAEDGTITVRTADLGEKVEISIEDNGTGMSREFIEKELFLPFHTTKSGGLGIGLFQSKKIMEAHHGTILVESEEGKGTQVRLIFQAANSLRNNANHEFNASVQRR